jgi:hypothetical protein
MELPPNTGSIALYAVRYATGRMSAAPSEVIDWCQANWHLIEPPFRTLIEQHVRRELERPGYLGMPCDVQDWQGFVDWIGDKPL